MTDTTDYSFDPGAENSGGGGDDLPTGIYALVLKGITLKKSGAGNLYGRARFQCINGPHKGTSMFTNVMLNVGNEMTRQRLKMLCDAMQVTQSFQANDEQSIMRALGNRPFIASVLRVEENGYTNHNLKRFVFPSRWSEGHRRVCEGWRRTYEDEQAVGGDGFGGGGGGGYGGDYDDPFGDGDGGGGYADFGDDEIPFLTCAASDTARIVHDPCSWMR